MVLSYSSHKAIAKLPGQSPLMQNIPLPQGEFLRLGEPLLWSQTHGGLKQDPLGGATASMLNLFEQLDMVKVKQKSWGMGRKGVPEIGEGSQILLSTL